MKAEQQQHKLWNQEHVRWLEDIDRWEVENRQALDKLRALEVRLKKNESFFQELKTAMISHEQELAHHEHDLDHGEDSNDSKKRHQEKGEVHNEMRHRHSDYQRRHAWVMSTIDGLESLLDDDSAVLN